MVLHKCLVGAHCSSAGGVHSALLRGQDIGATTVQIFTANQRRWHSSLISDEELDRWYSAIKDTGISSVMGHAGYLINLGSNNPVTLLKSRDAFCQEIKRAKQLGLRYLTFHPGSATGASVEEALNRVVESVGTCAPLLHPSDCDLDLLIETMAGQGTVLGGNFAHIAYLVQRLDGVVPIGVCWDLCHIFASGEFDISTVEGMEDAIGEFDAVVGLKYLKAIHVSDSVYPCGSKKDRHANLGMGCMGLVPFRVSMENVFLSEVPKYLETPNSSLWEDEIQMLLAFGT